MQTESKPTPSQLIAETLYGRDLLVSASAGSGKTHVLTERIILRLTDQKDPLSLSELLVVTFTRNATAQLKRRIAQALNAALAKNPGDPYLTKELLLLGGAQILTIDAFLQKLVREHFDLLGIPRGFRIVSKEEIRPTAERIMKETLEELYGADKNAKRDFFQALVQNDFARSMDHLLNAKRELDLRETLLALDEKFRSFPEGIGFLKQSADRLKEEKALPYFSTRAGKKLKEYTKERFDHFMEVLSRHAASITQDDELPYKAFALEDVEFCKYVEAALERGYDETKAALSMRADASFPKIRNHEKSPAASAYKKYRDNSFKKCLDDLKKQYSSFECDIRKEMEQSSALAESLYTCLSKYENRLMEEKKARGSFLFDDIAHFAHGLLIGKDKTPTSLARELSERYREVYVDEYQDVNRLQDEIFAAIGKGKRFLVGDIKQSIYAFRGGEPEVFAEYRRKMPPYSTDSSADSETGSSVFMAENFRCDKTIIETVNQVCSPLFSRASAEMNYQKEDDLVFGKKQVNPNPAPVIVRLFGANPGKEEAEEVAFVADEIKRLTLDEKIPAKDIVILVRKNEQAIPFAKALRARKIRANVQGDDDSEIPAELIELLNLLAAIDNPHRDIPLNEFLLSPMGNFTLEEIFLIRNASDKETVSLFEAMESYPKGDALSNRIDKTLSFLTDMRRLAGTLPVDKFLQKLYETEPLKVLSASDVPVYLYDQARQYGASSYTGLYEFLNYFQKRCQDGKIPKNLFLSEDDAVQILTIHKSKGEQYKVVFVATLANVFPRKELDASILISKELGPVSKLYDEATLLLKPTTDYEMAKLLLKEKLREEQIRLLYVAMTRAEERLYLTGTLPGNVGLNAFLSQAAALSDADRHEILAATSPMVWVFANLTDEANKPWDRKTIEAGTYVSPLEKPEEEEKALQNQPPKAPPVESRYAKILAKDREFVNEREIFQRLPSKIAASKISGDLFDRILSEDDETALSTRLELLHSATSFSGYLNDLRKPGATDYGSAMHAFLEFCDFSALAKGGVQSEIERLVNEGFLRPEQRSLLHTDSLNKFVKSDLFAKKILSAKTLRREQKFARFVPMKELTQDQTLKDQLGDEMIFVQGAMDLILENDEGLTLVDYKTDRMQEGEFLDAFRARMLASHGSQLKTYAYALEQLFGALPVSICLYSLPLGETIEFSMDELKET